MKSKIVKTYHLELTEDELLKLRELSLRYLQSYLPLNQSKDLEEIALKITNIEI